MNSTATKLLAEHCTSVVEPLRIALIQDLPVRVPVARGDPSALKYPKSLLERLGFLGGESLPEFSGINE